jgi:hypothetical protein
MPKTRDYIFVLWGQRFEEAVAALFVTELRQAGLLVKVVGLDFQHLSGAHGLSLLPDWTLSEALPHAAKAICVVIPCPASDLVPFTSDPRLPEFFQQASANQAYFIIKAAPDQNSTGLNLFPPDQVWFYPEGEGLLEFVRQVGDRLQAEPNE